MTNTQLFYALFSGELVEKDFAKIEPDRYQTDEIRIYTLYIYYDAIKNDVVLAGWGCQMYKPGDILMEIAICPNNWNISKRRVTDKPWIPKQTSLY